MNALTKTRNVLFCTALLALPLYGLTTQGASVLREPATAASLAGPVEPTTPIPGPGVGDGTRQSFTNQQPGRDGNTGWGTLPHGQGHACQNSWVFCDATGNPNRTDLPPGLTQGGGWVSAPDHTGATCQNTGVVCKNFS
ncbi:hypothetical protein [Mycobacteroides saopaulense]|uniref:hypothetical protein n=1 Tax=Mycobacteroides saopaulense TaxID=1578165 RepID=UPI000A620D85|nr:hypothetical protein [Mycobacteroides saopaulense]